MEEWALLLNDRVIKRFQIKDGQTLTIGRGKEASVMVDNAAISREHCSLEFKNGDYYLTDLYSLNGTTVNGQKVVSAVPIKKTDRIEMGNFTLQAVSTIPIEKIAESYLANSDDGSDHTVFVPAKSRKTTKPDSYRLTVTSGDASPKELDLTNQNSVKVGRSRSCDIVISGLFLSKTQFSITRQKKGFALTPLGSLRKTYINGTEVEEETSLRRGDKIEAGTITLEFL